MPGVGVSQRMTTTRPCVPSEVAHECLEGVLVRALESDAPVPQVVLPENCTAARVVGVLEPDQSATLLSPSRVPKVTKTLDNVRHVDSKPKRRPAKRKIPPGEGSQKGHAQGGFPGGGKFFGRITCQLTLFH